MNSSEAVIAEREREYAAFTDPLVQKLAEFLRGIGLPVRHGATEEAAFLPGLTLEAGGIIIDESKLLAPGDILHEAGHLAITPASERARCGGKLVVSGGEEMAAIAWSYATAVHLGIDPAVVFHAQGYRGGSDSLLDNFRNGNFLAVPLLQWMGLTYEARQAAEHGVAPYPHMIRWLRA